MSTATTRHTYPPEVQPVAGATFRRAAQWPIDGRKKRRVLLAIAAYLDAGYDSPSIKMLARRTGLPPYTVVTIVDGLERAGHLRVVERGSAHWHGTRNRYALPGA